MIIYYKSKKQAKSFGKIISLNSYIGFREITMLRNMIYHPLTIYRSKRIALRNYLPL